MEKESNTDPVNCMLAFKKNKSVSTQTKHWIVRRQLVPKTEKGKWVKFWTSNSETEEPK